MRNLLITGASGFVGQALIPKLLEKGYKVYGLYRQKVYQGFTIQKFTPLFGDITQSDLGLEETLKDIDAVIHSAALLSFRPSDRERIYLTNYVGTVNLLGWMRRHKITRLFHLSTAYLFDHNDYEISKRMAEEVIEKYREVKSTICRLGIVVGDTKIQGIPPLSGFYAGIAAIDWAKKWFEQKSKLPPLRARIRIRGSPSATLNLIPVDVVVESIIDAMVYDKTGVIYVTNPNSVTLKSLEAPISTVIGADIQFISKFKPNLLERALALSLKELSPYLTSGSKFPSDIKCPRLSSTFIERSIRAFLKG